MFNGGKSIYQEFWNLTKSPFDNINDPAFLFASSKHKEALARLRYAVDQKKQGALLIGEYGTGKTYLSEVLKKICSASLHKFVFFTNPRLRAEEFLKDVFIKLGGEFKDDKNENKADLLRLVEKKLEEVSRKSQHVVIVVDEGQTIEDSDLLEEIRLLLNMQGELGNYFTLLLLGQPQLGDMLKAIPQFKQRIAISYLLEHLDLEETVEYIRHRLKVAGAKNEIFSEDAYKAIYELSGGMPRVINNACDLALLHAFSQQKEKVDEPIVNKVAQEFGLSY